MKNSYTPYYNIPTCYMQQCAEADMAMPKAIRPKTSSSQTLTSVTQPQASTLESTEYMNGYLRTQIGKKVSVAFLIGTESYIDKSGILLGVGANYISIKQAESDDIVLCDFFTIKFVTFYS